MTTGWRVLHVINGEHYAGAERVQDLLAQRLPTYGFEVGFACIKPVTFAARRSSTVPLFAMPMRSRLDLRVGRQIADLARERGYGLIHTHSVRSALIGRVAARLSGLPMIHQLHSPARADTESRRRNWMLAAGERISLGGAAALIAVSDSLKRYLERQGFPSRRIHVVPNGVPIRRELAAWTPPEGRPWEIGIMALFRPRKGLEVLLDALSQLRAEGLAVRLRAVGPFETPDYEAGIRQRVKAAGLEDSIHWAGYVQDVDAELARMDVLVLPSLYGEGLPMVILEAMAAGVPVVASELAGVPQAVRDGIDGLLVEPGAAGQLARALRALIRGEICADLLRRNARARQAERFSDESMAQNVARIYGEVLRQDGSGRAAIDPVPPKVGQDLRACAPPDEVRVPSTWSRWCRGPIGR
ncbi:MAG: glycosyltransferase [Pseudomonadota bacterium]|nr:glycosyltransferase [Pseudomonadota bacterium]